MLNSNTLLRNGSKNTIQFLNIKLSDHENIITTGMASNTPVHVGPILNTGGAIIRSFYTMPFPDKKEFPEISHSRFKLKHMEMKRQTTCG